ncbi:MAG: hypothetical protein ABSG46_15660 [Candidatus Binataceae bacterium]|jgi:hypothetical protein
MDAGCDFRPVPGGFRVDRFRFHLKIKGVRWRWRVPATVAALAALLLAAPPIGQAGSAPDTLPDTAIAPADTGAAPAQTPPSSEEPRTATTAPPVVHHHVTPRANATPIPNLVFEVEPAEARVLLRNDTPGYLQPDKMSPIVMQLLAGKFIHVTGETHYFLQVKLKNNATVYVLSDDAYLTVPADKIFRLTSDTPVLARPNKWAKPVAQVHKGHDVHVVGVALSYMKIQMKSGLEGYITTAALE